MAIPQFGPYRTPASIEPEPFRLPRWLKRLLLSLWLAAVYITWAGAWDRPWTYLLAVATVAAWFGPVFYQVLRLVFQSIHRETP
jgi:hypothetical protein